MEGDIDKALKHTKAFYPQVLEENEQVHFRLRCRKFIEMIRNEAEMNLVGAGGPKGNHAAAIATGNNGHSQPPGAEEMELDEDLDDLDGTHDQRDLTQDALLYGQTLQAEYLGDERREVHVALNEIFGLMAYPNPLKEPKVAHLLDRKGRVAVAEELNSAILRESPPPRRSFKQPYIFKGNDEARFISQLTVHLPRIPRKVIPCGAGKHVRADLGATRRPGRDGRARRVRHAAERHRRDRDAWAMDLGAQRRSRRCRP